MVQIGASAARPREEVANSSSRPGKEEGAACRARKLQLPDDSRQAGKGRAEAPIQYRKRLSAQLQKRSTEGRALPFRKSGEGIDQSLSAGDRLAADDARRWVGVVARGSGRAAR
jgi:hypothetical protein